MYKHFIVFFIAILMLPTGGCASLKQTKWLSAHQKNIARLATGSMSAEEKLDGLLADYVQFMKEDLKFVNPVKGVKYVKKYHDQNLANMEKILNSTDKWQSGLNMIDKVSLGLRVIKKPYVKDLIDLTPKFKRKYKQYAFVAQLTSKLTGGLTRFAGKELGL